MRPWRAALLLTAFATPAALALPGWETSGPPGARANGVSASAGNDARVYAAASILESSSSALYRSDDGGRTWTAIIEAPGGDSYSEIFADPRSGERIFAAALKATGATDIYRSLDGGVTWSTILTVSTRCVPSFAVGAGPDSLLLTCGTRLLRTADAGLSWDEPATPFTENVRLTSGPGGNLYAYSLTRIFGSTTGGSSWTDAGAAPSACPGLLALRVDPSHAAVLVAGTGLLGAGGFQCGGVFRSENGGASWTAASLSGVYVTDVALERTDPARVYACASHVAGILPRGGVYVSGDGGRSFSDTHLPTTGALELAISATSRIIHAATPLGVYQRTVRKTRVVGPRLR
jgi:photosystem II stability/assembly factor-like uncharacterized protein